MSSTAGRRVSVVMPILDEERHLAAAVDQIRAQDWPGPLEIVLALGPSRDATDTVAESLAAADPRIVLVRNPSGRTPDGLNAAIEAASGDIIVRVDGHSEIPVDYISRAVETLERTDADNVGGVMDARGTTPFERAAACAMRSALGMGRSVFHTGGAEGPAETVYLGTFRRSALERVGGYDPKFLRAQDWELNHRLAAIGGRVWFTPDLVVTYRPRATVRALARQYFLTGQWRRVVTRHHRGTASARYLAPPVMVVLVGAATVASLWWTPAALVPIGYLGVVGVGGLLISRDEALEVRWRVPIALTTMHWAWGLGFLASPRSLGE